jgi:hypothetical protein
MCVALIPERQRERIFWHLAGSGSEREKMREENAKEKSGKLRVKENLL